MQFAQLRRRGRADRGNARAAQIAQVLKALEKKLEKRRHAVRAGEDQPVIGIQLQQRIYDGVFFGSARDLDGRDFQDFRAQFRQPLREITGLFRGA